jgi:hypothetical protein
VRTREVGHSVKAQPVTIAEPVSTLFLHIGAEKTGTSALQASFAANAELLSAQGTYYVPSESNSAASEGKITSGNALRVAKYLNPDLHFGFRTDNFTALFERSLSLAKGANVLYSSEFLEKFQPERLRELAKLAQQSGYGTRVIYYVRSIAGHALSTYSQSVKRHKLELTFGDYLTQRYRNPFRKTIEGVEQAIGADALTVLNFDSVRTRLVPHFFEEMLGLPAAGFKSPALVNRSLTIQETEFLRQLNARLQTGRQSTLISDALISIDPAAPVGFTITPGERELLTGQYDEDVRFVNARLPSDPIAIVHPSIREGERRVYELTQFEHTLCDVLARMAGQIEPANPATNVSDRA